LFLFLFFFFFFKKKKHNTQSETSSGGSRKGKEDFLEAARLRREKREQERLRRDQEKLSKARSSNSSSPVAGSSPATSPRPARQSLLFVPMAASSSDSSNSDSDDSNETRNLQSPKHERPPPPKTVPQLQLPPSSAQPKGPLQTSQSEIALPKPISASDEPTSGVPMGRMTRGKSFSSAGVPPAIAVPEETKTKRKEMQRSISQRLRKITTSSSELVSDTNLSSWVNPPSRDLVSPRNISPRKTPRTGGRGSANIAAAPAKVAGVVLVLNSSQKWSKRWCRICDSTLYVFHRDKMTGKPTGNPKREVSLGGCLVKVCLFATKVEEKDNNPKKKAETEKTVMGKSLVLEIVSLSDGVAVMSFGSVLELERWATIVRDAANDSRVADSAFPGIRVIQVEEQADDESWRALLAPADGWRIERSSTPLDVTFATGGEQSE
jgi:hypothetical protein